MFGSSLSVQGPRVYSSLLHTDIVPLPAPFLQALLGESDRKLRLLEAEQIELMAAAQSTAAAELVVEKAAREQWEKVSTAPQSFQYARPCTAFGGHGRRGMDQFCLHVLFSDYGMGIHLFCNKHI